MKWMRWIFPAAAAAAMSLAPTVFAQAVTAPPASAAAQPTTDAQNTNLQAYIELLRSNVQAAATQVLTETMQLNDAQAEKFWPIYHEFSFNLQKLNDKKIAGIKEYADSYDTMTDANANQLAETALSLENQRNDLKKTYYEKMRKELGGIVAARWLQVENQMLMVIDLQIASSLPVVSSPTSH
ncbi:MAG: hypothetical protein WCE63_06595 [Acidobacteriaceae bacterium]